jgi:hypothetical protein
MTIFDSNKKINPEAIVIPHDSGKFIKYLGEELQHWFHLLSGKKLPVCEDSQVPNYSDYIAIGHGIIKAEVPEVFPLESDAYVVKTTFDDGRNVVACFGKSETGTMYAVYELLEMLGVVFQMTGTIIPERKADLVVPQIDVRSTPRVKSRGYMIGMQQSMWMGYDEFKKCIRQMARMKLNCVMLNNFFESPFVEIDVDGKKNMLGDYAPKESGYVGIRGAVGRHTLEEISYGQDRFNGPRPCAPEFWYVKTPDEAKDVARELLGKMIEYAHFHKIDIYLGVADFPCIPTNMVRFLNNAPTWAPWYGYSAIPGEPLIDKVWYSLLDNLFSNYPKLDGIWIYLSEHSYEQDRTSDNEAVLEYFALADEWREKYGHLCKGLDEIKDAGMFRPDKQETLDFSFALINNLTRIIKKVRVRHPDRYLGVAGCGQLHLFPAMDEALDVDIGLLSLESCCCWCRETRVPLEWGRLNSNRDTWLVPRLSDDAAVFGPQWNVELYTHDRFHKAGDEFGFNGVLAQVVGNWTGLEQNADFLAQCYWNSGLDYENYYQQYCDRLFGKEGSPKTVQAFHKLEAFERRLGRDARVPHDGCWPGVAYFTGLNNFLAHFDIPGVVTTFIQFSRLTDPFGGPNWTGRWDVGRYAEATSLTKDVRDFEGFQYNIGIDGRFIDNSIFRIEEFAEGINNLNSARLDFEVAREKVSSGSVQTVDLIIYKLTAFELHLSSLINFLRSWVHMDRAFAHFFRREKEAACKAFSAMLSCYDIALNTSNKVCECMASSPYSKIADESYLLFRYQVRVLNPATEFRPFLSNIKNFYTGDGIHWDKVNWEQICLPIDGDQGERHW